MHNASPTRTKTPTTPPTLDAVFNFAPAAPTYLVASIATSALIPPTFPALSSLYYLQYDVDCPPSSHPDHALCTALGIYPAQIYHTQGSVYGGKYTNRYATATTEWSCGLGTCNLPHNPDPNLVPSLSTKFGCTGVLQATCNATITDASGSVATTTTFVDGCDGPWSSIPVQITAGTEKLVPPYRANADMANGDLSKWVEILQSVDESQLLEAGCPTKRPGMAEVVASLTADGGAMITPGPAVGSAGEGEVPMSMSTSSTKSGAARRRVGAVSGAAMLLACGVLSF